MQTKYINPLKAPLKFKCKPLVWAFIRVKSVNNYKIERPISCINATKDTLVETQPKHMQRWYNSEVPNFKRQHRYRWEAIYLLHHYFTFLSPNRNMWFKSCTSNLQKFFTWYFRCYRFLIKWHFFKKTLFEAWSIMYRYFVTVLQRLKPV